MNDSNQGSRFAKTRSFLMAALGVAFILFGGAHSAFAAVSVTTATGGTNISADKAANATSPVYTTLGNIVITSTKNNDFPKNQASKTLIFSAPSGWAFNPGVGTLTAGGSNITANSISVTSSTITATYTRNSSNSSDASLTISGIQVQATNGGNVPNAQTIFQTGGTSAAIAGITLNSTSFGSLSQVIGAASKLVFTTQPGSATYGSALSTQPVVKTQDQFNALSTIGLGTSKIATLTVSSGSVTGTASLDIGTAAGNGTVTFSGLSVSTASTGKTLTASATGLANGVSNTFTINPLAVTLTGTRAYDTTTSASYNILSVSNKVGSDNVTVASGSGTIASANVGAETISSFGTLTLGGTAAANYSLTGASGTVTVTKATPTLSVSNSPVTYSGSGQAATVSGSVPGTPSNTLTGGAATQTNAGTYAVTANFTPNDTTNYNSLTAASAGNFTINRASQTITFNSLSSKVLGDPDFTVSATASSGLTVAFASLTTGVCTVSGTTVHLVATGTCTIEASQSGNGNYNAATPIDQSFSVGVGALDHFTFAAIGTQVAGTPFSITITAQDVHNNTLSSYAGTVDLTTSAGTIVPVQSGVFSSGIRTESVTLTGVGTLKTITAVDHGGTKTGTSGTFTVNPGALDHFSFASISTQTAGVPFSVTMTAQDANNNTVTGYAGTVDFSTNAGTIAPIQSGTFSSGTRTESVSVTLAGTSKTITATDHGGTKTGTSGTFTVVGGAVASFSLNNPGDMYAKTRLGYIVTRLDVGGNAAGTGTTTVYLYSSSVSSTKKFYNDSLAGSIVTSIDIGPGNSTANFWYYDETPGTYTITVSDATPNADGATGIIDATDPVTVMPVATKFVIIQPANGTVDAPIAVRVEAQKPDGSIDTNYQHDVTLHATGSAVGGLVDIINGVGTKNVSDTIAQTVTLSLEDTQSTGLDVTSSQQVIFGVGALAKFTLSHPATLAAGKRAAYTIGRTDQYGNAVTTATTTAHLYSLSTGANKKFYDAATDGLVISSVQIPNGQSTAQVWYYDELPGTWSIIASDNGSAPDYNTGLNDAVDTLTVTAGPVASFVLSHPGIMTAGTRTEYSVTRKDQFNNLVTSGATTAYLFSNSIGTSSPAFYAVSSGGDPVNEVSIPSGQSVASFWYFDPNVGDWSVTASETTPANGPTGAVDAVDNIMVNAAPIHATQFIIMQPSSGTVDAPIAVTVKAVDANGFVDTSYMSDVTLQATGAATLPNSGLVDIVDGVGTINLSDTVAQSVTLTLLDSQGTGLGTASTRTVTFAPGVVAQLAISNPGDIAAGMRLGYTVSRTDQFGNAVTSGATTVNLSSSSTGANKKFYDAASGGSAITSIDIPDGQSSVGFWAYDEKAGNWFISVAATNVSGANDPVTIQPAALAKFTLNEPNNMTAGTRLGYTVTRKDQFDNLVTSGVSLAYFYSSSSATTTAFYTAAVGGATTLFATINDGSSSGDIWYYDETPGTYTITVSDASGAPNGPAGIADASDSVVVSSIPIVATRFVILPVASVQVGTSATVTVEAQDNLGNVAATNQSSVTLHTTGSATGAGLVTLVNGIGTLTLTDTVAETVTLSLVDSQTTGLNTSSTQQLIFSVTPVAPTTGGAGGVAASVQTVVGVQLSGRAPGGANVQVLAVSPEGSTLEGQTSAGADGSFYLLLKEIPVGVSSYGVVGIDALGRTTQTRVFNANYLNKNELLEFSSMLLSPILGLVHSTVRRNDVVGFVGTAVPGYTVSAQVDGKAISQSAIVADDGSYKILYPTASLALGSHTVRVRQSSPNGTRSDFAPQKVFTVTNLFTPQTDFNQDGVINVQDWSIFLSRWSSTNTATRMSNDLNGDGKVDVSDLSIFVRTLKR